MLIGILRNEDNESAEKWLLACQKKGFETDVIDLTACDAIGKVLAKDYDLFLLRPPGRNERYKTLYDERLYLIHYVFKKKIFPDYLSVAIYENKRNLASFLKLKSIPHPETGVYYDYKEASSFSAKTAYPIVAKTNIGAAGSGVKVLANNKIASNYIKMAFKGKGIPKRSGPNRQVGTPSGWLAKAIKNPSLFRKRLAQYYRTYTDTQKCYLIFQQYIPHEYEWRVVKIGESYFAYKKFKVGDKASGAKNLGYSNPPYKLLDFVRNVAEVNGIHTAAVDIFEHKNGYLVNEIQTIFGHVRDHILEVDGKPGRYLYKDNEWVFEEGNFNTNESYDLRLETALELYKQGKL